MRGAPAARGFVASLWPLLIPGLLILAAACSSAEEPDETAVPFMVCGSSQTWTRPSEEEQSQQVWQGPFGFRYSNWDPAKLRSTFHEDFFTWHGGNSELFDQLPLHGLWSAEDQSPGDPGCEEGGLRLSQGEVISIYLLLHEAKEVRLSGNTYRITVQETASGFQQIQFANLLFPANPTEEYPTLDYNLVIVDTNGRELARANGGALFQERTEESPVATAEEAPGADVDKILEQGRQATWLAGERDLEKAKEATALDNAKPRFKGQMGDFIVGQTSEWPFCPSATQWVYDLGAIKASELYSLALGENVEAAACADGTIISVFVEHHVGRFYFVGPPSVPYEAPADRLRLLIVGGKPAIAEIPIPDNFVSDARLTVIQRFPAGGEPGIAIGVDIMNDLDGAIKLAEQIMGVAP